MERRGRRKKVRYIQKMPKTAQFSPRGNPGRPDEAQLNIDHYEAIKLADYQGYNQSEGAKAMGVSRPTFGRILREGRGILADALTNSKIIRIRTGDTQVGVRPHNLPAKRQLLETPQKPTRELAEANIRSDILKFQPTRAPNKA
jgi:predicted DNA-binding protein (UPF0251 family)